MHDKIKNYQQKIYSFLLSLRDVRFAGLVLFAVIVLLISWSGVKSIQSNYELQKQISRLEQQNEVSKLQNKNLKLQNEYYKTNQYLELSARQNFGLAKPGEIELIVPKKVALSYTVNLAKSEPKQNHPSTKKPTYQRNFEAWVNFFLHRQSKAD